MRTLLHQASLFSLFFVLFILPKQTSAQKNSVFEEILSQAVLIQTDSGTGSAFLYKYGEYLYLITARHVIVDTAQSASRVITATLYPHGPVCSNPVQFSIDLEKAQSAGVIRYATSHDFFFIELGKMKGPVPIFEGYVKTITKPFYLPKFLPQGAFTNLDSLGVGEEVFLFGYPTDLAVLDQFDFTRPIMRTGAIAARSCANKGNRPTEYRVLLDARVDHGMSGGFVMIQTEKGKYSLIGIMLQLVPWIEFSKKDNDEIKITRFDNSGLSIVLSFDTIVSAIAKFQKERAGDK